MRSCASLAALTARMKRTRGRLSQPASGSVHEIVVGQVRVVREHAVDLLAWPGERSSCGSRHQRPASSPCRRSTSCSPAMQPREVVRGVEERGVGVGELRARAAAPGVAARRRARLHSLEQRDRRAGSRPPTARAARRRSRTRPPPPTPERGQQVGDDVVVVAGVERDVRRGRSRRAPAHVERLVAVERRDLDRHDARDLDERAPERVASSAGRRPRAAGRSRRAGCTSATARQWAISSSSVASRSAARLSSPTS